MALPSKKSRPISVNDIAFRYIISLGKNTPTKFKLNVTIQEATGVGKILKIQGLVTRDFWLDFPYEIKSSENYPKLTPKHISVFIQQAFKQGWEPSQKGPPFILNLNKTVNRLS